MISNHSSEWLARLAANIASQLPESTSEALKTLYLARLIILSTDSRSAGSARRRSDLNVIQFGETARE